MGGNDIPTADYLEKEVKEKGKVTYFTYWYVNGNRIARILRERGYTVENNDGILTISLGSNYANEGGRNDG